MGKPNPFDFSDISDVFSLPDPEDDKKNEEEQKTEEPEEEEEKELEELDLKKLSTREKIKLAKKLKEMGKTYQEIAELLGVSPPTACRYVRKETVDMDEDDEKVDKIIEKLEKKAQKRQDPSNVKVPRSGKVKNALDQSYASVLMTLMRNIEWFNAVMSRVGFYAMMLAFQIARIPPEEIPQKIEEFQDPDKFSAYVLDILSTLPIALEDAMAIYEAKKKEKMWKRACVVLLRIAKELMRQTRELRNMLEIAVASMDEKSKADFLTNLYTSGLIKTLLGGGWRYGESEEVSSEENVGKGKRE